MPVIVRKGQYILSNLIKNYSYIVIVRLCQSRNNSYTQNLKHAKLEPKLSTTRLIIVISYVVVQNLYNEWEASSRHLLPG